MCFVRRRSSSHRHYIIQHIFTVHIILISGAQIPSLGSNQGRVLSGMPCAIHPFYQIFRLHYRNISGKFGNIHIKTPIRSFTHRRVRPGNIYNQIFTTHCRLCLCFPPREKQASIMNTKTNKFTYFFIKSFF